MNRDYYTNSNDYINRWVISYADFITMLLALFMVLYAASSMGASKVKDVNKSLEKVFNVPVSSNVKNLQNTSQEAIAPIESSKALPPDVLEPDKIVERLKENAVSDTSVKVLKEKRGVVIRLNDTMLFDQGSAIIKPEAKAVLDKISTSLNTFKNPVVIEGHTDSVPIKNDKYPSNWELSTARATNIITYLTEQQKFTAGRLSAVGYGEYMPVSSNEDAMGKAKNRRVDIVIMSSKK